MNSTMLIQKALAVRACVQSIITSNSICTKGNHVAWKKTFVINLHPTSFSRSSTVHFMKIISTSSLLPKLCFLGE